MENKEYEQKKRECWEEAVLHGALEVDKDLLFDHAFKCGYALGKQEKDAEDTVISGWAARDKDNNLFVYSDKPKRVYDGEFSRWEGIFLDTLSNSLFPDFTWDDEPQEVEIIIKRKKK